ncbi:MAG: hypothetical protein KA099_00940 [Alphaproteobacteria bacterium]|nr:hypothetical protein [Alphaproteobacteria bacterium]MBP7758348.1 hypothetical protein [Alphaproteobacteria bacterium]MBP7762343.1 hypothetical protein [Alphaproteobacteria bacterium]MBP7903866.1 hypothetical protein [Alphaproteobacteria bacterium]
MTQESLANREKDTMGVTFFHSMRFRILGMVIGLVVLVLFLFTSFTLREFEKANKANIEHEGLLLSHTMESAIHDLALNKNIEGMQSFIDRLVGQRDKNDIEINVLMNKGETSDIVASNDPGNIEESDEEEHEAMLEVLKTRKTFMEIDVTDGDIDPDDDPSTFTNPNHIDYFISPGYRYMSLTTPLAPKDQELGSINVVLSLSSLDRIMRLAYTHVATMLAAGMLILAGGISLYLNSQLFSPLRKLASNIYQFGVGGPMEDLARHKRDEIGVINREFTHMVARIRKAEAENKAYLEEIEHQKEQVESLLLNILPRSVVERIHTGEEMIADAHQEVTVLFADLAGFTKFANRNTPQAVVETLNQIFFRFDELALKHGVEKIKTIGDAYMAVAGVPVSCVDHAERAARMALDMLEAMEEIDSGLRLRIGLHSGPVVAGVLGKHKFSYDVWGDTVNVASRYESAGEPGRIHVSSTLAENLRPKFRVESRGLVEIRDVGKVEGFFLSL